MADPNEPTTTSDAESPVAPSPSVSAAPESPAPSPPVEPAPPAASVSAPVEDSPLVVSPIGRQPQLSRRPFRPAPPTPVNQPDGASGFDAVFEGRSQQGLGDRLAPTAAYLLMIVSPLTLGLLSVPAALIAWTSRQSAPEWLKTHYLFQLRTFFTAAVLAVVAVVTELFGQTSNVVGVVASAIWMLCFYVCLAWFVLRSTLGLARLRQGQPIRNWRTWLV